MTIFTIAIRRARLSESEKDAALCQLFIENLSGASLQWLAKLKPCTIDSFNDLSQAFMIPREESTADVWNMVQKKGESLRAYIDSFKAVASLVTMDDVASIEALRKGLWYECHF